MTSRLRVPTPARPLAVVVALVGVFLSLSGGALWFTMDVMPIDDLGSIDVAVLILAGAMGQRLVLPRAHGRSTTMVVAVVGALALLHASPVLAVAAVSTGWAVDAVLARRSDRRVRVRTLAAGAVSAWGFAGFTAAAGTTDVLDATVGASGTTLLAVIVAWSFLILVTPAIETLELHLRGEPTRRLRYRDLLHAGWQSNTVLAATATLGALAYPTLGAFTVPLMALPLLAAKLGFDRNTEIRTTYSQTLRAMSRLPEQLGAVESGHGVRVGALAGHTAARLGFTADVVTDVERAGHLHELGRIRSENGFELEPEEVAAAGSAIVREAGGLDRVADLIDAHRGPVRVGDELAWVGGAVIRLACELDQRMTENGGRLRAADELWLRGQGVEDRVAEALIESVRDQAELVG